MGSVGSPCLKLKFGDSGRGKHSGNAAKIAFEALFDAEKNTPIRHCSDEDYRPEDTKKNLYVKGSFRTAQDLLSYWAEQADAFRIIEKNGKEKRLRSDANIGGVIIGKIDSDYMNSLSPERQKEALSCWYYFIKKEFDKRGIQVDSGVIHMDEGVPHMHIFFHDPEYKLGKKMNLAFYKALNRNVPAGMRQKGFDIRDMVAFDEEKYQSMSEDEKQAYIANKKRKKHGLSSAAYKAEQETKKQREELAEKQAALEKEQATVESLRITYETWNADVQQEKEENKKLIELGRQYNDILRRKAAEKVSSNVEPEPAASNRRRGLDLSGNFE